MPFLYTNSRLPKERALLADVEKAAHRLYEKLVNLDVNEFDISDYNKRYLDDHIKNLYGVLQRYAYIMVWSVANMNIPFNEFVFLEYGGGTGIMSMLAKELCLGTVIYNDIYDVSCRDAEYIGKQLGNQADYYVGGNLDSVIQFVKQESLDCHAVASNDVIEHIYDVEQFFEIIPLLSSGPLCAVMATSANDMNPLVRRSTMKKHIEAEYCDTEQTWGCKERDCLRSFLKVRQKIINKSFPDLEEEKVKRLACATRGMMVPEIKECVNGFMKSGRFPDEPEHPTNTCDPYTGNWADRLLDLQKLEDQLKKHGFRTDVYGGYYGRKSNFAKNLVGYCLNIMIRCLGRNGAILAPFIIVTGIK